MPTRISQSVFDAVNGQRYQCSSGGGSGGSGSSSSSTNGIGGIIVNIIGNAFLLPLPQRRFISANLEN
jgi:hypothetical protein